MKLIKNLMIVIILILLIIISANLISAKTTNSVQMVLFYGEGCPHCAKEISFLDSFLKDKPTVTLNKFEVYFNNSNRELFEELMKSNNQTIKGVPALLINNEVIFGYNTDIKSKIEEETRFCLENKCNKPLNTINKTRENKQNNKTTNKTTIKPTNAQKNLSNKLTLGGVIMASFIDSINPCAFAVLILLLSSIINYKNKKKALWSGLAFSVAIFISYLLMGLGLYHAIGSYRSTRTIFFAASILAIIIGLSNIKDFFWYKKWFVMEVPLSWRPKMKSILSKVKSVPGAFTIGFLISLFLLPCTSGPYIVILGLLSQLSTFSQALGLLLIYNLIFITPMIIITIAVYLGLTSTEKAEQIRQKRLRILHLIAGLILLIMGFVIFLLLALGKI